MTLIAFYYVEALESGTRGGVWQSNSSSWAEIEIFWSFVFLMRKMYTRVSLTNETWGWELRYNNLLVSYSSGEIVGIERMSETNKTISEKITNKLNKILYWYGT